MRFVFTFSCMYTMCSSHPHFHYFTLLSPSCTLPLPQYSSCCLHDWFKIQIACEKEACRLSSWVFLIALIMLSSPTPCFLNDIYQHFYDSIIWQYLYILHFLNLFLGWFYNLAFVNNSIMNNFQVSLLYTDLYVTEES